MTSADIQVRINANAAEQAQVLAGDAPNKIDALRALQEQQARLYTLRDVARRNERGRAPAERAGL